MSLLISRQHFAAMGKIAALASLALADYSYADVAVPLVPPNVNCQFSPTAGTVCGLYTDVSASAGASSAGKSFSYQPSWAYTSSRFINQGVSDGTGAAAALAQATDFVTFGSLKSQLSVTATTGGAPNDPNAGASANSTIGFQDRLTFNLPGVAAGTLGTMIGRVQVSGSVDASTAQYPFTTSGATAAVSVSTVNGLSTQSVAAYGDRASTGGIPQFITFVLPVSFNVSNFTLLFAELQTTASASALNQQGNGWTAAAHANFFNSMEWSGIDAVLDAQGNPVTGWSVSSASGFDYTKSYAVQAVPLPAAAWLFGSGLLDWPVLRGSVKRFNPEYFGSEHGGLRVAVFISLRLGFERQLLPSTRSH